MEPSGAARWKLRPNEVHLWRAFVTDPEIRWPCLERILSPGERVRANRYRFEKDRALFVLARARLRILLARYTKCEPEEIELCFGARGKPEMRLQSGHEVVRFNVSHSGSVVMLGFSADRCVGVDVEKIRSLSDLETLAPSCLGEAERAHLLALREPERSRAFFRAWTLKEALLKATGKGLAALREVELSLADEPPKVLSLAGSTAAAARWGVGPFALAEGYVAAAAHSIPIEDRVSA